jgi:hypothetical protein
MTKSLAMAHTADGIRMNCADAQSLYLLQPAAVNTVSLYVERGKDTFHSIHVEAAKRIAMLARQAGAETLVHISGIGANAGSASPYIRSRGSSRRVSFGQVGSPGCRVRTW